MPEKVSRHLCYGVSVAFLTGVAQCLTKPFKERRIYFGSQFEGVAQHGRESMAAAM